MCPKALIIGATSGIGKALAKELLHHHYHVGIIGRRAKKLEKIKLLSPQNIFSLACDITQEKALPKLEKLISEMGGMDLLVLSAGVGFENKNLDYGPENTTNQLNVVAFTKVMCWGMNFFIAQGHGHLANISSVAMHRGNKVAPAYSASKAYQSNYLEGLSQKVHQLKLPITITDIRPGFVKTAMAKAKNQFWVSSKEKAAKQIFSALKKKRSVTYISRRWVIIGKLLALLPKGVYKRM
ncbi:MAG: SDR family NAD(P)-dependent oxidoreductase [Flavobacteriaceae bacterium]